MTKRQLPLIGRIQERLAPVADGRGEEADERSRQQDAGLRDQADWVLERIRRTAAQFLSLANHGAIAAPSPHAEDGVRKERALLLGYKLTLTAWRRREESGNQELLRSVRSRMVRELAGAAIDSESDGPGEGPRIQRTLLDPADSDISASLIRFEAGLPGPLTPFYGDLAPAFGGPCPSEELSARYGKVVRHLYESVEKKLDERDRAELAPESRVARRAGISG